MQPSKWWLDLSKQIWCSAVEPLKIKRKVSYGSSPAVDIEDPKHVETVGAPLIHRDPSQSPLGNAVPGLAVVALDTHALNFPIGHDLHFLPLCDNALAWWQWREHSIMHLCFWWWWCIFFSCFLCPDTDVQGCICYLDLNPDLAWTQTPHLLGNRIRGWRSHCCLTCLPTWPTSHPIEQSIARTHPPWNYPFGRHAWNCERWERNWQNGETGMKWNGDGFYRTKHVISHDLGWVEANQVIVRRNIMTRDWWKRNQVMHHDQGLVENESGDWWKTNSQVRGLIVRRNIMGGPYGYQISSTRAIPGPRAMIVRQDDSYRRTPLTLTSFVMPNQDPETVKQYKDEWYVKNREAMLKRKQQHPVAKKKQHPPPSRQWEEENLTDRHAIDTETAIVTRRERSIALITTATGRGLCDNNMNVEPTPRTLFINYVLWPKCVPSSWDLSTTYQRAQKLEQHRQYRVGKKTAVDGMVDMKAINRQQYWEKIAQLKAKGEYETFKKHKATVGKWRYHNMSDDQQAEVCQKNLLCQKAWKKKWCERGRLKSTGDSWMCDIEKKPPRKKRAMGAEGCKDSVGMLCQSCEGGQTEPLELVRRPSGTCLSHTMATSWVDGTREWGGGGGHCAGDLHELFGSDGPLLVTKPNKMNRVYIITSLLLLV